MPRPGSDGRRDRREYRLLGGDPLRTAERVARVARSSARYRDRGTGHEVEKGTQAGPLLFKRGPRGRRHWLSGTKVYPRRIARDAGNAEFVVEMRSGGETGGTDIADHIALTYPLADMEPALESLEMSVASGDAVWVTDLDQIAVPSGPSHMRDHAVARRHHRSAGICGVVGALV